MSIRGSSVSSCLTKMHSPVAILSDPTAPLSASTFSTRSIQKCASLPTCKLLIPSQTLPLIPRLHLILHRQPLLKQILLQLHRLRAAALPLPRRGNRVHQKRPLRKFQILVQSPAVTLRQLGGLRGRRLGCAAFWRFGRFESRGSGRAVGLRFGLRRARFGAFRLRGRFLGAHGCEGCATRVGVREKCGSEVCAIGERPRLFQTKTRLGGVECGALIWKERRGCWRNVR